MDQIQTKVIPHSKQRLKNGDVADYYEKNGKLIIAVSDTGDVRYNFLIMLHEFVELFLIKEARIPIRVIDEWDCEHPETMGDDAQAPYHRQHKTAENVERYVAGELGISWRQYEQAIERMSNATRRDRKK